MSRTRNFTRSGMLNVGFQLLFLALLYLVGSQTSLAMEGIWKHIILVILVLVPSLVWTLFFYLQDRNEPEPAAFTLAAFVGGMAAAALLGLPLLDTIFHTGEWLYRSGTSLALGSILVVGSVASFLVYLVVRYAFYPTREFDEPEDGMVYGAFVGAGYAFVQSLNYLAHHPDFTLFAIAYTATTNILVYASVGALVGYFVGQSKFSGSNVQTASITAILVGMVLIGIYHVLNEFVFLQGFQNALVVSALLTFVFAVVVLGVAFTRIRKLEAAGVREEKALPIQVDWLVAVAFVVFLGLGGIVQESATRDAAFTDPDAGIRFTYAPRLNQSLVPANIVPAAGVPQKVLFDAREDGEVHIQVRVLHASTSLENMNALDYINTREPQSTRAERITVGGKSGLRFHYSYVEKENDPHAMPRMLWAYTDVVPVGERTFVFTYTALPAYFQQQASQYEALLNSVEWITQ